MNLRAVLIIGCVVAFAGCSRRPSFTTSIYPPPRLALLLKRQLAPKAVPRPKRVEKRELMPKADRPEPPPVKRVKQKPAPPPPPPKPPVALVSARRAKIFASYWPRTAAAWFNALKSEAVYYDDKSVPRFYQVWDETDATNGLIPIDFTENGNKEFPWNQTAGLHATTGCTVVRAVKFGGPILWWRAFSPTGRFDGLRWDYAPGTVFVEILQLPLQGELRTFEVRTREKQEDSSWDMQVFRPFPTEKSLRDALAQRGITWRPKAGTRVTLESTHGKRDGAVIKGLFSQKAVAIEAPSLSAALTGRLLSRPFEAVQHRPWRRDSAFPERSAQAASFTGKGVSIVPRNYLANFIRVDNRSCMRCHEDAGRTVVEPEDRRWRLRGDDSIFSFNPIDPSSPRGSIRLNRKLLEAGLIRHKKGMP